MGNRRLSWWPAELADVVYCEAQRKRVLEGPPMAEATYDE